MLRTALIASTLLGLLICSVLLNMSLPSPQGEAGPSALCTPTPHVNCDYVLNSPWARIGPVPTAAIGLLYFLCFAVWYGFIGIPNVAGRFWHFIPLLLGACGIAASLAFTYVMAVALPVWCTWCIAAHVVNFILFVLTAVAMPRRTSVILEVVGYPRKARALSVIGACAATLVTGVSLLIGYRMQIVARQYQTAMLKATNNADYIAWRLSRTPKQEIRADKDFCIGKPESPHVVFAFTDFECDGCAGFHRFAARLTNLFPDTIHIVFRHCPLCRECNPHSASTKHFFACEAAHAAEAARRTGTWQQAFAYQEMLFSNAARLSQRPYVQMATAAGMNATEWKKALDDPATSQRIARDVDSAHAIGVEGTPAIFLDGRRLENWHLLTTDAQPVVDLEATDRLWKRLLTEKTAGS